MTDKPSNGDDASKKRRRAPSKAPAKAGVKAPIKAGAKAPARAASKALVKTQPRVLVTGGTGFLGTHLVNQLLEDGAQSIRVLATSNPAWLLERGVELVQGSITNAEDVRRAVEGVTEIYHLAGYVSRNSDDAPRMYDIHVNGTRLLCEAAREAGVKSLVMSSSSGTLAVTKERDIVSNENVPPPLEIISRWPYYASKYYQEQVALEHFAGDGARLVMLNPSLLFGPGDARLSSTKVVLDFIERKILAVPTGGLNFVDVRDVARAFRVAMKTGRHGERYLLGGPNWTFREFFGRLGRLTKVSAPRVTLPTKLAAWGAYAADAMYKRWHLTSPVEAEAYEMAGYFWYIDSSKAAQELGFVARDPAETLYDTVSYLRENFVGHDAFV